MKLTVDNAAFTRAVRTAVKVAESRNPIPILCCCRLEALAGSDGGALEIEATDMERVITIRIDADVEVPGAALAESNRLAVIANSLTDGGQVNLAMGDTMLAVTSGRSRWRLGQPDKLEAWPKLATGVDHEIDLPGADFAALLGRVAFAISSEISRYYLCGAFLQRVTDTPDGEPALRAVATDGHKMGYVDMPWPSEAEPGALDVGVIVPRRSVDEMRRLAADATSVSIGATENLLRLTAGDTTYLTKLIDGIFPDYRRASNYGEPDVTITVDGAALRHAVGKVLAFAKETGVTRSICLARSGDGLAVAGSNSGEGDAVDRIDATIDGDFDFFELDGRHMKEALAAMDADTIIITRTSHDAPSILRSAVSESHKYVLSTLGSAVKPAAITDTEQDAPQ